MNTATIHPAPEEIMALYDGELSPGAVGSVSRHIDECPDCAAVLSDFKGASQSVSEWGVSSIPKALVARIEENAKRVRAGVGAPQPTIFVRASLWTWGDWSIRLAPVGVCLLLLLIGLSTGRYQRASSGKTAGQTPVSVDGARVNLDSTPLSPGEDAKTSYQQLAIKNEKGLIAEESASVPAPPQAPMIARSAALTILVTEFPAARATLDSILIRHHAYAAELKATTVENVPRSLVAILRVPANDLGPTLTELKALGRLQEETQNGEEVTQQHTDLVARLKNSRETEQRLQAILAQRTGKMSDVLEVEHEISRVRGEIESMEAELKTLDRRVEFASVNLILNEEYQASMSVPPLSAGSRLRNAVVNGFRSAGETILGIVLFFAEYGLTLAIWLAILGVPIYLLRRRYRRALTSV